MIVSASPANPAIRRLSFEMDAGIAHRAAIGLVVLASDQTLEHEFHMIATLPGVCVFESRIFNANDITPETLRAMEGEIAKGTELILPGVPLDVVGFGCTSASMLLGEATIGRHIHSVRPGVRFTTPVTGAFAGLRALGAQRIAILTPYSDLINEGVRAYVEQAGFAVPVMGSFKENDDHKVARIAPRSIMKAIEELVALADIDAVFVSCTNLRIAAYVPEIERQIGKPVTSSNHALAWHSLRLAGIDDQMPRFGTLFTVSPSV